MLRALDEHVKAGEWEAVLLGALPLTQWANQDGPVPCAYRRGHVVVYIILVKQLDTPAPPSPVLRCRGLERSESRSANLFR